MNNKGFTLIELLGVIVLLSVLLLIAIPNIQGVLDSSKRDHVISDAKKFVSLVEYQIRKKDVSKPTIDKPIKVSLGYVDSSDVALDFDGNSYDLVNSYVILTIEDGFITYYVNLVSKNSNDKYTGVMLTNIENLSSKERNKYYQKNIDLSSINEKLNQIPNIGSRVNY